MKCFKMLIMVLLSRILSWLRTKCENFYLSFVPEQVKMAKLRDCVFEWKSAEG